MTVPNDEHDALDVLFDLFFQTDAPGEKRVEKQKDEIDRLIDSITGGEGDDKDET